MNITSEQKQAALNKLDSLAFKFSMEVEPLYKKLKWNWRHGRVPTQKEIYWEVKRLIEQARNEGVEEVQTGGLVIRFDNDGAYLCFSKEYAVFWEETPSRESVSSPSMTPSSSEPKS